MGTLAWIPTCLHELTEAFFACLKFGIRQPPAKEFIAEPDAIGVENLAVFGNLTDMPVAIILLDFSTAHAAWFSRQPHCTAQFVQSHLAL